MQCEETDVVSELAPLNTVFFTRWNSLGDHLPERCDSFLQHARRFYKAFSPPISSIQKHLDFLYLPRGTKENFLSNDRLIPAQDTLLSLIPKHFLNSRIYNTDDTENIIDQILLIKSAKVILLDYGSSLLVNSFFAENTFFFVLGDFGHIHCKNPKPYMLLEETLARGCHYCYLPVHWDAYQIISAILDAVHNGFPTFQHHYTCWRHLEGHQCSHCENRTFSVRS